MASTWRALKLAPKIPFLRRGSGGGELSIPTHFRCPISLDLMRDPVTLSTGITYDRQSIEKWLDVGNRTCPVTNQLLADSDLIPNHSIRKMIQDWCVANRSHGIERIPTPRIPVTAAQVSEILSDIAFNARKRDKAKCDGLVLKLKALAKESERNKRCFASGGAARVLAASFAELASGTADRVLEDILSAMAIMFPLDEEARWQIGSTKALESIVAILNSGDLAGRVDAVLVAKELVMPADKERSAAVAKSRGLVEALVKLVKDPISPLATKASLVASFYLVSCDDKVGSRLVDMGLVPVLLEILVDSEKGVSEKALGVLNGILSCREGRETAYDHSLTVPILVKKLLRVSDVATDFAVSALWRLCRSNGSGGEGGRRDECLMEAMKVGAFQKLLLLLQVGCSEGTKEKASELLKMLNGVRGRGECIETVDFKGLKRAF